MPICRKVPIHSGQRYAAGNAGRPRGRQRNGEARRERDAEIRALLAAALKKLQEGES